MSPHARPPQPEGAADGSADSRQPAASPTPSKPVPNRPAAKPSPRPAYPGYERHELAYGEEGYPDRLCALANPPRRLYLIGDRQALAKPAMAIVGARKASPYGLLCANRFARRAAFHGLAVVSGGAIGCDQAAHQGALEMGEATIVVLGCGADVVYPNKAEPLFEQILAAGGLLLSELPWGSPPASWAFIKRNRLIAGLASATLIVEAGLPSGTFSTADATLGLGSELLVVPGSILSKQSAGSNRLIAQGAWPIIDDASFDAAVADIYMAQAGLSQAQAAASASPRGRNGAALEPLPQVADDNLLLALADELTAPAAQPSGHGSASDLGDAPTAAPPAAVLAGGAQPAPQDAPAKPEGNATPSEGQAVPPDPLQALRERLQAAPAWPDQLIGVCGADVVEVIRYLSSLEFAGQVTRMLDGRFALSVEGYGVGYGGTIDKAREGHEADNDSRRRPGRL